MCAKTVLQLSVEKSSKIVSGYYDRAGFGKSELATSNHDLGGVFHKNDIIFISGRYQPLFSHVTIYAKLSIAFYDINLSGRSVSILSAWQHF